MLELVLLLGVLAFAICIVIIITIIILRNRSVDGPTTSAAKNGIQTEDGEWTKTNITFFDDTSGFTGIDLFEHAKKGMTFDGQKIYPCAVHHDDAADYLWSVLDLRGEGMNTTRLHVVDICNRNDDACTNRDKNGLSFLIDVHETGWNALGKNDGVLVGEYKKVGAMFPKDMDNSVFLEGDKTYVMCSCTDECTEASQKWTPVSKCTR